MEQCSHSNQITDLPEVTFQVKLKNYPDHESKWAKKNNSTVNIDTIVYF